MGLEAEEQWIEWHLLSHAQYAITPILPQCIFRTDADNNVNDMYAFQDI